MRHYLKISALLMLLLHLATLALGSLPAGKECLRQESKARRMAIHTDAAGLAAGLDQQKEEAQGPASSPAAAPCAAEQLCCSPAADAAPVFVTRRSAIPSRGQIYLSLPVAVEPDPPRRC